MEPNSTRLNFPPGSSLVAGLTLHRPSPGIGSGSLEAFRWNVTLEGIIETMTRAKDHIGAILAIIVSSFIVVGSIVVVIRTSVDLFRARKRSRKDRRGGAKRLRKMLVIGLLAADGWIAWVSLPRGIGEEFMYQRRLSSIGPAVSGLMGDSLSELQCDPAGFVLASALWWSIILPFYAGSSLITC